MGANINIDLNELPDCPTEGCGSKVFPFYDVTQEGGNVFLKGWGCMRCGKNLFFDKGSLKVKPVIKE